MPTKEGYGAAMKPVSGSAPLAIDRLNEIVSVARARSIVAFGLRPEPGFAMCIDLPLGEPGECYAWIGYWDSEAAAHQEPRPRIVVASGAVASAAELRRRVVHMLGFQEMVEVSTDDACVVVASSAPLDPSTTVTRVTNIDPHVDAWLRAASRRL